MRSKNFIHKIISLHILCSLVLVSCSKDYPTSYHGNYVYNMVNRSNMGDYNIWKTLVTSDDKNIALAEILSSAVSKESKNAIADVVSTLSNDEVETIISSMRTDRENSGKYYFFMGNEVLENSEVYRNSIFANITTKDNHFIDSDTAELKIAVFSYLKSKSLDEIYKSFDRAMEESSKEIAKNISVDISKNNLSLGNELEEMAHKSNSKNEFYEYLKTSKEFAKYLDTLFKDSDLNCKEQLSVVLMSLIGGALYLELKESKKFSEIYKKYQDIKFQVEDLRKNINTIKLAVTVIRQNKEEMDKAFRNFNEGLIGIKTGLKETYESGKNALEGNDPVNGKKLIQFVYDKVILGKNADSKNSNPSILNAQNKIDENIVKSSNSVILMADNLSNIINATNLISQTLGITLPRDLKKALDTAGKISAGFKLTSMLVSGAMSGGVLSAVGLLSSGPVSSLLGIAGNEIDPAIYQSLNRIEEKLDLSLANQKKMLEVQIETIKMIKNLAIMIDEYHQNEMRALADLRALSLVNLELNKVSLNRNIISCEAMIDYKLKASWGNESYFPKSRSGDVTIAIDFQKFYSQFKGMDSFKGFVKSTSENNFSKCQDAFVEAFGSDSINENPILSIFSTSDQEDLYTFQSKIYLPLVDYLKNDILRNKTKLNMLHIPTKNMVNLDTKQSVLTSAQTIHTDDDFSYNLENLISIKSLERYTSSLLVLFPIFEFDKSDWDKDLQSLVNSYYENLRSNVLNVSASSQKVSRGYYFLKNSLNLIHSAMAQEALLSGELIIPKIRSAWGKEIFKDNLCGNKLICSIRSNKLLMKNYLNYAISKSFSSLLTKERYKMAIDTNNTVEASYFLFFEDVKPDMIINDNGELKIHLRGEGGGFVNIPLPKLSELENGQVLYSENMDRLIKMQKDVISALVKVSPSKNSLQMNRDGFAQLLFLKNY